MESSHLNKTTSASLPTPVISMETKFVEKGTQTIYDTYLLGAVIENMMMQNAMKTALNEQQVSNKNEHRNINFGNMDINKILTSDKDTAYFTGLDIRQFSILFEWLSDAKNHLEYWNGEKNIAPLADRSKRVFSLHEELC